MPELCRKCGNEYEPSGGSGQGLCPSCELEHTSHGVTERASVRAIDGLIEFLAIVLIVFTPLAFGATERWSRLVAELIVVSMCGMWCIKAILRHRLEFVKSPLNVLVAAFVVVACLQLVPLPGVVAARVSPGGVYSDTGSLPGANKAALAAVSAPVVAPAAVAPANEPRMKCISANRAAGKSALFLVVTYAIAFIVIINTVRRRPQISRLLAAVVVVGFIVAMVGILGKAAPNGKVLWLRDPPTGAIPFGPFVNRNHFAGYLAMVVPVALGMMIATRNRDKRVLLGFASAVMAVAVLASASRGGAASLAAGGIAVGLMLVASKSAKKNVFPLAVVGCLALVGAMAVGIEPLLSRSSEIVRPASGEEYRLGVWKDTTKMIADFPLLGVGLGCFRHVFPMYKTLPVQLTFSHAENDYLQLLAEVGIVGFGIGIVFLAIMLRYAWRGLKGRRSTYSRGILIGLAGAVTVMLVHSLVDFNLHVPSNGLLFAMLLGLLVVLSSLHLSRSSGRVAWVGRPLDRVLKGETVVAPGTMAAFSVSLASMCLLAFLAAGGANSCVAQRELDSVERDAMRFVKGEGDFNAIGGIAKVQSALRKDGNNAEWRFRAGVFYQTLAQIKSQAGEAANPAGTQYLYSLATNEFRRACSLDCFNGHYRAVLAIDLAESGKKAEAEAVFRQALRLDPTNAWIGRNYGAMVWDTRRDVAQDAYRRSLELDPHYTTTVLGGLLQKACDLEQIGACVPRSAEARFEYAAFLSNNKLNGESEKVLVELLPSIESDGAKRPLAAKVFFELGQIRQSLGCEQDAMACFVRAVSLGPDEHAYWEELGYTCLRQKRYAEAKKFLEQRLRMDRAKDANVFMALGEVYENVGPMNTANQYYRKALDAFPASWDVSRSLAMQGIQRTSEQ